jgi:CBS domain-containing protein
VTSRLGLKSWTLAYSRKVADVMTRDVITARRDTPLGHIAAMLERNRIKRVPIVEGGKLVGILLQEVPMAIVLDHTIVPAHDKEASARFLARILGLRYEGALSHFAPLRVNDTLTLDFDNDTKFESHHYAFKVDEAEFDGIFDRVRAEGIAYAADPACLTT